MSMILRRAIQQSLSGGGLNIAEVFSVDLWTGTGALNSIDTGLDFVNNDGLAWVKSRTQARDHRLADTLRGAISTLQSNESDAETLGGSYFESFTETGYELGLATDVNQLGQNFVGWNFIKAPKFFDVIKYTGDGVAGREIPHELGVQAGMCMVKKTNANFSWYVQHTSRGDNYLILNDPVFEQNASSVWNGTPMTNKVVTLGSSQAVNKLGDEYVMYVFAHDPAPDGVIQCGQYMGNGTTSNFVNLDTPWAEGIQYIMIKVATASANWVILDTTRGINNDGTDAVQYPNLKVADTTTLDFISITPTGFEIKSTDSDINAINKTYIYMAIRAPSA